MTYIKIYGAVNSGTIYLEWLIKKNLDVKILDTFDLGWKHRIAPSAEEITREMQEKVIFVCLSKNPYPWLLSMHKRPYHHESLKKLSFSEFIKYSYGDYRNLMVMWNKKNQSYLDLKNYVQKHEFVKYEEVLDDPKLFLDKFADSFQLSKPSIFLNIQSLLTNSHGIKQKKFQREYYTKEQWKSKIKTEDIEYINSFLDKQIMEKLNYSFL